MRQWRCACGVGIAPNHTTNLDVRHMVVGLNKWQLLAPSLRGVLCVALPPLHFAMTKDIGYGHNRAWIWALGRPWFFLRDIVVG